MNRVWSTPDGVAGVEMGLLEGKNGVMVDLKFYDTGKRQWWAREHLRSVTLTHQEMLIFKSTGRLPGKTGDGR